MFRSGWNHSIISPQFRALVKSSSHHITYTQIRQSGGVTHSTALGDFPLYFALLLPCWALSLLYNHYNFIHFNLWYSSSNQDGGDDDDDNTNTSEISSLHGPKQSQHHSRRGSVLTVEILTFLVQNSPPHYLGRIYGQSSFAIHHPHSEY